MNKISNCSKCIYFDHRCLLDNTYYFPSTIEEYEELYYTDKEPACSGFKEKLQNSCYIII